MAGTRSTEKPTLINLSMAPVPTLEELEKDDQQLISEEEYINLSDEKRKEYIQRVLAYISKCYYEAYENIPNITVLELENLQMKLNSTSQMKGGMRRYGKFTRKQKNGKPLDKSRKLKNQKIR